jgi:hypothetical protein
VQGKRALQLDVVTERVSVATRPWLPGCLALYCTTGPVFLFTTSWLQDSIHPSSFRLLCPLCFKTPSSCYHHPTHPHLLPTQSSTRGQTQKDILHNHPSSIPLSSTTLQIQSPYPSTMPVDLHHRKGLTIMTSPSTIGTYIQLASPESAPSTSPATSSRPIIASVPMCRSTASMGTPYNPMAQRQQPFAASASASLAMSRSPANNNSASPRRIPAPISMARSTPYGGAAMGRHLPYGGVAMERSKSSMGTDFNPYYCRQAASPRAPPLRVQVPVACPMTPTLLPSPPASPTTPTPMSAARDRLVAVNTNVKDENKSSAKRSALTPRAFPVSVGFPESPRSVRPRRRRGLSAPPPLHLRSTPSRSALLVAIEGTKSLRLAAKNTSAPIRALPFHHHPEPMPVAVCSRE